MGVNLFIRKTFNANALKRAVNESLDQKITALRKDKALANQIATKWGEAVTRFVPRSDLDIPEEQHLQAFTVSDGRVIWRRKADEDDEINGISAGDEIAHLLYEGPIRGTFHSRYDNHEPQAHWDQCVTPGTDAWQTFVDQITPEIREWVRNNG